MTRKHRSTKAKIENRTCALCGRVLKQPVLGRAKKFCGDYCRKAFNTAKWPYELALAKRRALRRPDHNDEKPQGEL